MVINVEIAITKMSSKGQVVIPSEMRAGIEEGEKMLVIQNNGQIIIKKASTLELNLTEDLEFAKRTEEALRRIEDGKGERMDFKKFIDEMKKW